MSMMAMNRIERQRRRKRTDSIATVEASGEGLLCFSADGSWFRGQMESTDDRYFDLCGRLVPDESAFKYPVLGDPLPEKTPVQRGDSTESMEEDHPAEMLLERTAQGDEDGIESSSSSIPMSGSPQEGPSSPQRQPGSPSDTRGSLNSVGSSVITPVSFEAAMRALADVPPGAPVTYDVHIRDHEEASEYHARFVPGWSGRDVCQLDCKELQFAAQKRYRGDKADMLIQKRLGPALVGHDCVVFTGDMHIEYQYDYLATPKWCL